MYLIVKCSIDIVSNVIMRMKMEINIGNVYV